MNNETDRIIYAAGPDTESIQLSDLTLSRADIEVIAKKLAQCTNLRRLAITDSNLKDEVMEPLIRPILGHPTLLDLDFSGNAFKELNFARVIVDGPEGEYGNPRIRSINISRVDAKARPGANFAKAVFKNDNVVSLRMDTDVWDYFSKGYAIFDDPEPYMQVSVNCLSLEFDEYVTSYRSDGSVSFKTDHKRNWAAKLCNRNLQEATRLLDRVKNANIISPSDVEQVDKRLPAILYLGEQADGRKRTVEALVNFYGRAKAQDPSVDLQRLHKYLAESEYGVKKSIEKAAAVTLAPLPPPEQQDETAYDIPRILARLGPFNEPETTRQIEVSLERPIEINSIGRTEIKIGSDLQIAAFHIMTSMPSRGSAEKSMESFFAKFQEAVVVMGRLANRDIQTALSDVKDELLKPVQDTAGKKGWMNNFWGSSEGFDDVVKLINEARGFLVQAGAELQAYGEQVAAQIEATDTVSGAYVKVGDRMAKIIATGNKVLAAKHNKSAASGADAASSVLVLDDQKQARLTLLESRLGFLNQTSTAAKTHLASYTVHAGLIQEVYQRISSLLEGHLPLLTEEVSALGRQVSSMTSKKASRDMTSVTQVFENVGAAAASMITWWHEIDDAVMNVRAHVTELFPTASAAAPQRATGKVISIDNADTPKVA